MISTKTFAALCTAAALAVPGTAAGAAPTMEREEVDVMFVDEHLSEACGIEARVHLVGREVIRTREGGEVSRFFNGTATITSEFGSFRVKDVRSESTRMTPDGQVIGSIRGQIPFYSKGVLKFDVTTDEFLNEPNLPAGERQQERACAALNPEG